MLLLVSRFRENEVKRLQAEAKKERRLEREVNRGHEHCSRCSLLHVFALLCLNVLLGT